jgi:hypothetical protein
LLWQSLPVMQAVPFVHCLPAPTHEPPQSVPVSSWLRMPSLQVAARQVPAVQTVD